MSKVFLLTVFLIVLGIFVYFMPTIVAYRRGHFKRGTILAAQHLHRLVRPGLAGHHVLVGDGRGLSLEPSARGCNISRTEQEQLAVHLEA